MLKRSAINKENIEGRIFEHDLTIKTVQNQESDNYGKEFISGTLNIAVDEEGMNVIPVHYTYVTKTTKNGGTNSTFTALKKIIDEGKVWVTDGKDAAMKVKASPSLALNDFYGRDDQLVSVKTNEGGFLTIVNELSDTNRNRFEVDMLITSIVEIEANPEQNIENPYVELRGAIFNFRGEVLPITLVVRKPEGMKYFLNLEVTPSNPIYTKVWGAINCLTVKQERTEESAFGEPVITTYEKKNKEWEVTGTTPVPYDFGDEKILTMDDFVTACQNREVMLADKKKLRDEYQASRIESNSNAFAAGAMNAPTQGTQTINRGGFQF